MSDEITAGSYAEPLPEGAVVRRMVIPEFDGSISELSFVLSSEDLKSELKSLSVFESLETTAEQCRAFVPESKQQAYTKCACLPVDDIRSSRPNPESPKYENLDVCWDPIDPGLPHAQLPGAGGHSGITGLEPPKGVPEKSVMYRSLRQRLATLATKHPMTKDM